MSFARVNLIMRTTRSASASHHKSGCGVRAGLITWDGGHFGRRDLVNRDDAGVTGQR